MIKPWSFWGITVGLLLTIIALPIIILLMIGAPNVLNAACIGIWVTGVVLLLMERRRKR